MQKLKIWLTNAWDWVLDFRTLLISGPTRWNEYVYKKFPLIKTLSLISGGMFLMSSLLYLYLNLVNFGVLLSMGQHQIILVLFPIVF